MERKSWHSGIHIWFLMLPWAVLLGCSPQTAFAPVQDIQITPADGAQRVPLTASVTIDFGMYMDRPAAEAGVHLIAESDMDAPCPDSLYHGTMDQVMNDPAKLRHMDEYHSTKGRFSWNEGGSVCTFHPDSLLRPGTYMVHLGATMLRQMMRSYGPMRTGYMNAEGDWMTHFRTVAAAAP